MLERARAGARRRTRRCALSELAEWRWDDGAIRHVEGRAFEVIGVRVQGVGREVASWDQPMLAAIGVGLAALLVTRIDGIAHVLLSLRSEVGYRARVEFGPTVMSRAGWAALDQDERPAHLSTVLDNCPEGIRFNAVQSEEGGRLYRTRTRYLVVEVEQVDPGPGHLWVTLGRFEQLVQLGHVVDIEARSLLVCVQSLLIRAVSGS